MKKIIKVLINSAKITIISFNEYLNYIKYCGFPYIKKNKIDWKILLLSHSLEKGLSIPNPRIEYGADKANELKKLLSKYNNKESYIYTEGLNVLQAYIDFRKKNKLDYDQYVLNNDITSYKDGGILTINKKDIKCNAKDFEQLCKKRHSVRNFSNKYVTITDVKKIIEIAKTCPTACNRQMINVYTTNNQEDNQLIAEIIPGNSGNKNEKCRYLVITSDMNAFDYYEINQWYLNGGIFVSYLQLACTSNNIGSCIYQWPKIKSNTNKIKKILDIPKNEEILTILAIGYYKDEFNILKAKRKEVNDILIERN